MTTVGEEISGRIAWAFVVRATNDDGREIGVVGVATTEAQAKTISKGKGAWGAEGHWKKEMVLVVGDDRVLLLASPEPLPLGVDLPELRKQRIAEAGEKVRGVLTPEEIDLLGLKLPEKA